MWSHCPLNGEFFLFLTDFSGVKFHSYGSRNNNGSGSLSVPWNCLGMGIKQHPGEIKHHSHFATGSPSISKIIHCGLDLSIVQDGTAILLLLLPKSSSGVTQIPALLGYLKIQIVFQSHNSLELFRVSIFPPLSKAILQL